MGETVYQEPVQAPLPPQHARRAPSWKNQPPQVWGALAAILFLLVAAILYFSRREPPPMVLGASARSIAVSSSGELLAVGTLDGTLRLVSPQSGHTLAHAQLPGPIMAVSFGPDESVLALVQDQTSLFIFSKDLGSHAERTVQPNPRDVAWSAAMGAAIVASGGAANLSPNLEFFPAQPLGIAQSTSQLVDLRDWSAPVNIAVSEDGLRVAITLETARRANVLFYDAGKRNVSASSLVTGKPVGLALAPDAAYIVSPGDESITEITARSFAKIDYPKLASTSPLSMIAVNAGARRAYTTGSLTFPEVDLQKKTISRTFELPARSAAIALSPDLATAYLTFKDANKIGVLNLQDMKSYREIELRRP